MNQPSAPEIRSLLQASHSIAVVGLSDNPLRPSYGVSEYMQSAGYRIIPVNPRLSAPVLGEQPYARLDDVPGPIDIVNIFRRSEFVPSVIESAIGIGAKAIWMQEGVIHEEAAHKAIERGLLVIMDRCILKEHRRLLR